MSSEQGSRLTCQRYVFDTSIVDELNNEKFRLAQNNLKNFSLAHNICDSVTRLTQMYPLDEILHFG